VYCDGIDPAVIIATSARLPATPASDDPTPTVVFALIEREHELVPLEDH
jgi:hypothetical protein